MSFYYVCKLSKYFTYPIILLRPITKSTNSNICSRPVNTFEKYNLGRWERPVINEVANLLLFTPDMEKKRGRQILGTNMEPTFLRIKNSPTLSH